MCINQSVDSQQVLIYMSKIEACLKKLIDCPFKFSSFRIRKYLLVMVSNGFCKSVNSAVVIFLS